MERLGSSEEWTFITPGPPWGLIICLGVFCIVLVTSVEQAYGTPRSVVLPDVSGSHIPPSQVDSTGVSGTQRPPNKTSPRATRDKFKYWRHKKKAQAALFVSVSSGGCWIYPDLLASAYTAYVGVRWRWLELNFQAMFSSARFKKLDMFLAMAGISVYSLRMSRIRLRHGLHGGVAVVRTSDYDYYKFAVVPHFYASVLTVGVRLVDGLWFEASNANLGYRPLTYVVHVGLRWER